MRQTHGEFGEGSRTPTIKDVAERAGVSPATVSQILNDTFKGRDFVRERVLEAIRETGYQRNAVARALRTQRTSTLGLIVADLRNPFYADVAEGVMVEARRHGYEVFVASSGDTEDLTTNIMQTLSLRQVDGLVLSSGRIHSRLPRTTYPYVMVNRRIEGEPVDFIGIDNVAAAATVVDQLWAWGHRRIAFVQGVADSSASQLRQRGYEVALRAHGEESDPDLLVYGGLTYEGGYRATHHLIELGRRAPTAIFAADDIMALGVLDCLDDCGYRVPDDMSVVGFDGIWMGQIRSVRLSTVVQPRFEMGQEAVRALLGRVAGENAGEPREILLPFTLSWGRTTRVLH
jgi:LacI family transcriptional regulator